MTTKEIAEKCNVTEQSIRNWCKKNNVQKAKQSQNTKIAYLIDENVKNDILAYYNIINENLKENCLNGAAQEKQELQDRESKTSKERQEKQNDEIKISNIKQELQDEESKEAKEKQSNKEEYLLENEFIKQLRIKDEQLAEKDKQIAEKDKQIESLTVILNAAQETQQQLTSTLTAAQALHAGTLQERLTDGSSSTDESRKHQSLFKRLFKRKSY